LTRIAELANNGPFNGFFKIGIFKDNERCIPTELHGDFFHRSGSEFGQHFTDAGTARKADFLDDGIGGELGSGLSIFGRNDMNAVGRNTCVDGQFGESCAGIRSFTGWLDYN
jgi:hypothetical protein